MKDKKTYLLPLLIFCGLLLFLLIRYQNVTYRLHSLMKSGKLVSHQDFVDSLDFSFENNLMFVNIKKWNDTDSQMAYRFLFDTGSPTYFSKKLTEKFEDKEKFGIQDEHGEKKEIAFFFTDFKIQNTVFEHIGVGEMEMKSPKIDGIIGANLMQHCVWQIDYPKRKVYFANRLEMLPKQANPHQISFIRNIFRIPCIYLTINRFPRKPMALISSSYPAAIVLDGQFSNLKKSMLFSDNEADTLALLALGDLTIEGVSTTFGQEQLCYLGSVFLKDYILTFDWTNRKIYISQ